MRPVLLLSLALAGGLATGCHSVLQPGVVTPAFQDTPHAHFAASKRSGRAPLTVGFHNMSTGTVLQNHWIFSDGMVFTDENPIRTFDQPGSYAVSLFVVGPGGTDLEVKRDYIVVKTAGTRSRPVGETMGNTSTGAPESSLGSSSPGGSVSPTGGGGVATHDDSFSTSELKQIFPVRGNPFRPLSRHHTVNGISQYAITNVPIDPVPLRLVNPLGITMVAAVLFYERPRDDQDQMLHMKGRFVAATVVELPPHGSCGISCDAFLREALVFPNGMPSPDPFFPRDGNLNRLLYAEVISVPKKKVPVDDDDDHSDLTATEPRVTLRPVNSLGGGAVALSSGDDDDDNHDDDDDDDDKVRLADGLGIVIEAGSAEEEQFHHEPHLLDPRLFSLPQDAVVLGQKDAAIMAVLDALAQNDVLSPIQDDDLFKDFGIGDDDDDDH